RQRQLLCSTRIALVDSFPFASVCIPISLFAAMPPLVQQVNVPALSLECKSAMLRDPCSPHVACQREGFIRCIVLRLGGIPSHYICCLSWHRLTPSLWFVPQSIHPAYHMKIFFDKCSPKHQNG